MLAVLVTSACANATPQAAQSATSQAPTTSAPNTPAATPSPSLGTTLVEYARQGGLAGLDDRIIVKQDGEYTMIRRARPTTTRRLSPEELTRLRKLLDASDFAKIPSVNPGNNITDGFKYRIVYQGREVLAEDGGVPPKLEEVFGTLDVILGKP
jgi:hypothetical protein